MPIPPKYIRLKKKKKHGINLAIPGLVILFFILGLTVFSAQQRQQYLQHASVACTAGTSGDYSECTNSASLCSGTCGLLHTAQVHWTCGADGTRQYTCNGCGSACGGGTGTGGSNTNTSPNTNTNNSPGSNSNTGGTCTEKTYNECTNGSSYCSSVFGSGKEVTVHQTCPNGSSGAPSYVCGPVINTTCTSGGANSPSTKSIVGIGQTCGNNATCDSSQGLTCAGGVCQQTQCSSGSQGICFSNKCPGIPAGQKTGYAPYNDPNSQCSTAVPNGVCCALADRNVVRALLPMNSNVVTSAKEGRLIVTNVSFATNLLASKKILGTSSYTVPIKLNYDPKNKYYLGETSLLAAGVPSGTYHMSLHIDSYLDSQLLQADGSQSFTVSPGSVQGSVPAIMRGGDLLPSPHGDNFIDSGDYNTMLTCMGQKPKGDCLFADLNNDGVIDNQDMQILLSNFGQLGFSFQVQGFTCGIDPACKTGQNTMQLCTLICKRKIGF